MSVSLEERAIVLRLDCSGSKLISVTCKFCELGQIRKSVQKWGKSCFSQSTIMRKTFDNT